MELTRRLNPGQPLRWRVMENYPKPEIKQGRLRHDLLLADGFEVSPGKYVAAFVKDGVIPWHVLNRGSYQHAAAINSMLKEVTTRYVLVMDPDFFIVRPNWIAETLAHMQRNKLAWFGAPFFADEYMRYRYFPSIICSLIDLEQVDQNAIDFSPDLRGYRLWKHFRDIPLGQMLAYWQKGRLPEAAWDNLYYDSLQDLHPNNQDDPAVRAKVRDWVRYGLMARWNQQLWAIWPNLRVNSCRDPGWKNAQRFGHLKHESLQAMWRNPLHSGKAGWQRWLPERFSIYPKRRDYTVDAQLPDVIGNPDEMAIIRTHWEAYAWQGSLFGVHVKGHAHVANKADETQQASVSIALAQRYLKSLSNSLEQTAGEAVISC